MRHGLSLALMLTATPCLAETAAGIDLRMDSSLAERPLSMSIWYPSQEKASASIGGNAVFEGIAAAPDAALPTDKRPLVVVSHGGMRSAADSGAWLSSSLAQAGYIVVEVNAPRPDNAIKALDEIWQRPGDIRRAIDFMLADDAWGRKIDQGRISVAGFALGATAALSVAGAVIDGEDYVRSCVAGSKTQTPDCGWLAAQGAELTQTNQQELTRLDRDSRVTSIVAVNPEYRSAIGAGSKGVDTLLIMLGNEIGTLEAIGDAEVIFLPEASAFDAFAVCTKAGPKILLEEEGDASLCGASAHEREAAHKNISEAIITFLR